MEDGAAVDGSMERMVPPRAPRQNNLTCHAPGPGNFIPDGVIQRIARLRSEMRCYRCIRMPSLQPDHTAMPTIPSALNPYTQTPIIRDRSLTTPLQDGAPDTTVSTSAADRPRIEISQEGRTLSASRSSQTDKSKSNDEIDDSGLPETIKGMLKQLRELNEQLAEQKAQLQAILAKQDIPAEERQARLAQVQGTINTLTGALSSVMNSLNKHMSEQDLSSEQRAKIASLIAKYAS